MISILIFILISTQVRGRPSWCNNEMDIVNFETLGIYRFYEGIPQTSSIRLYSGEIEVLVELTSNKSLIFKSREKVEVKENMIYKFSVFETKQSQGKTDKGFINCQLLIGNTFYCPKRGYRNMPYIDFKLRFPTNPVILKPLRNGITEVHNVLVFDRSNVKQFFSFDSRLGNRIVNCTTNPKSDVCQTPLFIRQMSPNVFSYIEGVTDFKDHEGKSGYLLLFKDGNRHKYCVTFEGRDVSDECKSLEKMKSLETIFDECFKTDFSTETPRKSPRTSTETIKFQTSTKSPMTSTQTNEDPRIPWIWILIALFIIIIIAIIGIIVVWLYISQKQKQKSHQESPPRSGSRRSFRLKSRKERIVL